MQHLQAFKDYLSKPRKMVILTHLNPDADALGSSLGLARYLKKKGHTCLLSHPSDYPDFIDWMPVDR